MMINDPLSDLIARIRNAHMRKRSKVLTPASRLRQRVLDVLQDEGYIRGYSLVQNPGEFPQFEIELKYFDGQPVREGVIQLDDSGEEPAADLPLARSVPLKLDANGSATTSIAVDQPITQPTQMAVEMDYEDANGETLTSSRRIMLFPSAVRLGVWRVWTGIARTPRPLTTARGA